MRWHRIWIVLFVISMLPSVSCQQNPVAPVDQPDPGSLKLQLSVGREPTHMGDIDLVIELSNTGADPVSLESSSGNTVLELAVEDTTGTEVWRRSEAGRPVFVQQTDQEREIVLAPGERVMWSAPWQRFEQRGPDGDRLDSGTYSVCAKLVRNRGDSDDSVVLASSDPVTVRLVHD